MLNVNFLQNLAKQAFNLCGDTATTTTSGYYHITENEYDTSTGELVTTGNYYTIKTLFTNYTQRELLNTDIKQTDMKVIIISKNLNFIPSIGDKLTRDDNSIWFVKNKEQDFAKCFWFLQVRPTYE